MNDNDTTAQLNGLIQKARNARTENPDIDRGHGCDNGWVFDDHGQAARCKQCVAEQEVERFRERIESAGIGRRYLEIEWDDLEVTPQLSRARAVSERLAEVVETGENAVFHGPPGSGKTQAAVLLVKTAIRQGFTARIENLGRLAMDVRARYNEKDQGIGEAEAVHLLSNVHFLVLDDVGAGETAAGSVEGRLLYLVTEARQNHPLPTLATTNHGPRQLAETIGQRIINRLQPLSFIEFSHGRNFRRPESDARRVW